MNTAADYIFIRKYRNPESVIVAKKEPVITDSVLEVP